MVNVKVFLIKKNYKKKRKEKVSDISLSRLFLGSILSHGGFSVAVDPLRTRLPQPHR
jgi:hypothetical protein